MEDFTDTLYIHYTNVDLDWGLHWLCEPSGMNYSFITSKNYITDIQFFIFLSTFVAVLQKKIIQTCNKVTLAFVCTCILSDFHM